MRRCRRPRGLRGRRSWLHLRTATGLQTPGTHNRQAVASSRTGSSITLTTLLPRERSKSTLPSTLAKRVSSEPLPTFCPGFTFEPRWRTIMLPAVTTWPPYAFTPSLLPAESRPLREEPPPFLLAIRYLQHLYP